MTLTVNSAVCMEFCALELLLKPDKLRTSGTFVDAADTAAAVLFEILPTAMPHTAFEAG